MRLPKHPVVSSLSTHGFFAALYPGSDFAKLHLFSSVPLESKLPRKPFVRCLISNRTNNHKYYHRKDYHAIWEDMKEIFYMIRKYYDNWYEMHMDLYVEVYSDLTILTLWYTQRFYKINTDRGIIKWRTCMNTICAHETHFMFIT